MSELKNHDGTPKDLDKFESVGKQLSEQFKHLQENRQVLDWWQQQLTEIRYGYQGVSHTLNKVCAERQELIREIQDLKDICERLSIERDAANAAVGKLQSDLLAVSERMDRFAAWAKK